MAVDKPKTAIAMPSTRAIPKTSQSGEKKSRSHDHCADFETEVLTNLGVGLSKRRDFETQILSNSATESVVMPIFEGSLIVNVCFCTSKP